MDVHNIEYYDRIAKNYDEQLISRSAHMQVRQQVAALFKAEVKEGSVLDFGGGTGMDLQWLYEAGYNVFFYEPSGEMKKKAIETIKKSGLIQKISLVDSIVDRRLDNSIDNILANFAVFNSIQNIFSTFEYFSEILRPEGNIFLLVIDTRISKMLIAKKYFVKVFLKIMVDKNITEFISQNEIRHSVYLHFIKDYRNASEKWFKVKSITPLGGYGFLLLQLCRK